MKGKVHINFYGEYFFMNDYGQTFLFKVTSDGNTWVRFGVSGRYRKFSVEAFNCLEPKLIGKV